MKVHHPHYFHYFGKSEHDSKKAHEKDHLKSKEVEVKLNALLQYLDLLWAEDSEGNRYFVENPEQE